MATPTLHHAHKLTKHITKQCSRCGDIKEASTIFFPEVLLSKDGLGAWCRVCCAEYSKRYRKSHVIDTHKPKKPEPMIMCKDEFSLYRKKYKISVLDTPNEYIDNLCMSSKPCAFCGTTPSEFLKICHDIKKNITNGDLWVYYDLYKPCDYRLVYVDETKATKANIRKVCPVCYTMYDHMLMNESIFKMLVKQFKIKLTKKLAEFAKPNP